MANVKKKKVYLNKTKLLKSETETNKSTRKRVKELIINEIFQKCYEYDNKIVEANSSKMMIRRLVANKNKPKLTFAVLMVNLLTLAICNSLFISLVSSADNNNFKVGYHDNRIYHHEFQSLKLVSHQQQQQQLNSNDQPANNEKPFGKFFYY